MLSATRKPMCRRLLLLFTVFLSLLLAPLARPAAGLPSKVAGCAMLTCASGCCSQMPCCNRAAQEKSSPEQAPVSSQGGFELAAVALPTFPILYVLPVPERRLALREAAQSAHTLPRLAATCIQLI